jgi:hypothetical protein
LLSLSWWGCSAAFPMSGPPKNIMLAPRSGHPERLSHAAGD